MGNIIRSLVSGFANVVGDLFGAPLDFLSGKSCSFTCGSTWDLICYIENFCVANLLKLVAVLFLSYIVLFFTYLLYKTGICGCLGRGMCKMLWAFFATCFTACEYGFMFLWIKLKKLKRMRKERIEDMEDFESCSTGDEMMSERMYTHTPRAVEFRSSSIRSRERRRIHMERSLRPRSHRIRVGLSRRSVYLSERHPHRHGRHVRTVHDIRVTRTSKFVHKGSANRFYRRTW